MMTSFTRAALLLSGSIGLAAVGISPVAAAGGTSPSVYGPTADQPQDEAPGGEEPDAREPSEALEFEGIAGTTDIISGNTLSVLLDARLALANGERSWVNRGLGKTRFQGTADGDYNPYAVPVEADLIWTPRFTGSLSANVSAAWQRDQDNAVDLIEAFVNFLPSQSGPVGIQLRAGMMWPEISLEHSTGGAWSVVDTITPSAINSWVGEEVKVLGAEATVRTSLGEHALALTGGVFGYNDTSGTLLSFRGWTLHDEKATAFGYFPLPPFNEFISHLQEDRTRSLLELVDRPGFYGRIDWRPPAPIGAALFYYDNRGDPEAFTPAGQWGWRTRFWNLGVNADLGDSTRVLAQGMTGSTIMGFETGGREWVYTKFRSAFLLVSHRLDDRWTVAGRVEAFETDETGSEMSPLESEDGWSWTAALKYLLNDNLTIKAEALNVRSRRGVRAVNFGIDPFQAQTVFQLALVARI
jgi:hypothetical protein